MKRLIHRIAALLCALCLLCAPACAASREAEEEGEGELWFSDVPETSWFYAPVRFLAERGILQGFEDGTFRPMDTLTEGQLIKLMLKPYMPEDTEEPRGAQWWAPYAEFGLREGILTVEDLAGMNEAASRLRVAQLLSRLPLLPVSEEYLVEPDRDAIVPGIVDWEEIPEADRDAVTAVYAAGIMQGYDDGCFHPERILTRAEGAAVIQRLMVPELRQMKVRFTVPEEWFADALLLGNSHCGGLSMYGELPEADFCFSYGGSIFTGLDTVCRDRNERSFTLRSLLQSKQYGKIILIYGTNEMGYDIDYLRPRFETFLDKLAQAQPQAQLWLCAAPPVNPDKVGSEVFSVANCRAVNRLIRELAAERSLGFLDVFGLFADEDGILPSDYTGDGIHLTMEGYREWGSWLASAVLRGGDDPAAEDEPPEEEGSPGEDEPPEEEGPPPEEGTADPAGETP